MTALRRLWVPVLAALLVAALVGPTGVTAAEPRATTGTITVPGAAFGPREDDNGFINDGYQVVVVGPSTDGEFVAPLFFETNEVVIRKITLYAYDNGSGSVCVTMNRSTPASGSDEEMGEVCSTGAATGIRSFVLSGADMANKRITAAYGPYLHLWLPGTYSSGYSFYAVKIVYSY